MELLLSESNKRQQDINDVRDDLDALKFGFSLLQHAVTTGLDTLTLRLKKVVYILGVIEDKIDSLQEDVDDLDMDVEHLHGDVEDLDMDVANLQTVVNDLIADVGMVHTDVTDLDGDVVALHADVTSVATSVGNVISAVDSVQTTVATIESGVTDLDMDVENVKTCVETIDTNVDDIESCLDTLKNDTEDQLGEIQTTVDAIEHPCGSSDDWIQVINFDMTDTAQNCPSRWSISSFGGLRTCGRQSSPASTTCFPADFLFPGSTPLSFSKVCGRVKAYAYGGVDAFESFRNGQTSITSPYVNGVVLLADNPPEHLWTFAAALGELGRTDTTPDQPLINDQCPCDRPDPSDIPVPSFVGNNYFCESGQNVFSGVFRFQSDDPLWDGKNCNPESRCCEYNRPPYFMNYLGKTLTVNVIEARICVFNKGPTSEGQSGDDVLVEQIEVYVA